MSALPKTAVAPASLLEPGRNCWRIEHAGRVRFLIDACAFFDAARKAMVRARSSITIVSWDVDSRTCLVPGGANDGWPEPLGKFLRALVRRRRQLRVNVLTWDFAMVFGLDREWSPVFRHDLRSRQRLQFRLDAAHPVSASHHQKLIVIDDQIAFCGGLDITRSRWDTPKHSKDDPLRVDPGDKHYPPFHDVQVMFDGPAAAAIGELARERWRRATGKQPRQGRSTEDHDRWPDGYEPDLEDVELALVRTEPAYGGREPVFEVQALMLDAIAAARRHIFIEQQYFTSNAICEALMARLQAPDPPELVVILSSKQYGWLEEKSMGVLRAGVDLRLRAADRAKRYRPYVPRLPVEDAQQINVHTKLMIVDDEFLTLGSANMSNRSMGLDTECNIALEARGEARIADAIAGLRENLLAEHLDVQPEDVARELARGRGLAAAIDALRGRDRTLLEFEPPPDADADAAVSNAAMVDPERPMEAELLVEALLPPEVQPSIRRRVLVTAAVALASIALIAVWHLAGLRDTDAMQKAFALLDDYRDWDWAAPSACAAFLACTILPVPVVLMTALATWVFGPWVGLAIALPMSVVSAFVGYGVGRALGRQGIQRFGGRHMNRLVRRLAKGGVGHVVLLRVLPAASFAQTNWVAGASRIGFGHYALGSALGLAPALGMTVLVARSAQVALEHPTAPHIAALAAGVALVVAVAMFVSRRIVRPGAVSAERHGTVA